MVDESSASWRVWYADSGVYDSTEMDWVDLPDSGMLGAVVYYERPYREIVNGGDWFYLDDNGVPTRTETHDEWGEWVPKPEAPDEEIKQGQAVSDELWQQKQHEMQESREWP